MMQAFFIDRKGMNKKKLLDEQLMNLLKKEVGEALLFHLLRAVPSGLQGLTSLFGMGRGEHLC